MLPVGLAGPLVMPPVTAVLLNSVPDALAGTASGMFNTSRQLGGALAIAVFGALLAQSAGFDHGLRLSRLIAAAAAVAAAVAVAAAATGTLLAKPAHSPTQTPPPGQPRLAGVSSARGTT